MPITDDTEYQWLTGHLEYLDQKIFESFVLFTQLATAIVGGTFYIYFYIPTNVGVKTSDAYGASVGLFVLVSVFAFVHIFNYFRSWLGYRTQISTKYLAIVPQLGNFWWWFTEAFMLSVIGLSALLFWLFNPLRP